MVQGAGTRVRRRSRRWAASSKSDAATHRSHPPMQPTVWGRAARKNGNLFSLSSHFRPQTQPHRAPHMTRALAFDEGWTRVRRRSRRWAACSKSDAATLRCSSSSNILERMSHNFQLPTLTRSVLGAINPLPTHSSLASDFLCG